ncbi:MAG: hypothetical protein KatS3mg056_1339 [Chloroflexus sp.]|nr:MAG: hypothetical protein KatS3mg056_1339 [Chloroflexus sp.]
MRHDPTLTGLHLCITHNWCQPRAYQRVRLPWVLLWATGPVAERRSSRVGTCWMDCLTRSSSACRAVWSAAAMLPRQPCSRSGAWHTVTHPGHGEAGCVRFDHRGGRACIRYLCVDGYVARDSCLRTSGHGQHLTAMERMLAHGLEACATGSACSPANAA